MPTPAVLQMYGISQCDTVKKAKTWLMEEGIDFDFHDFKKSPPNAALLNHWMTQLPWQLVINKKGTTWRKLPGETHDTVVDATSAVALALQWPSVIKRPIVVWPSGVITCGFAPTEWLALIATETST